MTALNDTPGRMADEMPVGKSSGDTHPGKKRENNEDRVHCDPERGIFIVIDGVGGQAAGEVAAGIALGELRGRLERKSGTPVDRIREAIALANNDIYRLSQQESQWHGMACVLTVAVIENNRATIGHVGDTRLYEIHRGQIRKITHDHSPVGEREEAGDLTELEAMRHPRRNEIYRDVGSEPHELEDEDFIEVIQIPLDPDSALLLCSDGLTDLVTSEKIRQVIERNAGNPDQSVRELIDLANEAGGKDNISVIVIEGGKFSPQKRNRHGQAELVAPSHENGPWRGFGIFTVITELANPILIGNVIAGNGAAGILATPLINQEELLRKNFFSIEGKPNQDGNVSVVGK